MIRIILQYGTALLLNYKKVVQIVINASKLNSELLSLF